jgi:hypothetical protein
MVEAWFFVRIGNRQRSDTTHDTQPLLEPWLLASELDLINTRPTRKTQELLRLLSESDQRSTLRATTCDSEVPPPPYHARR